MMMIVLFLIFVAALNIGSLAWVVFVVARLKDNVDLQRRRINRLKERTKDDPYA